MSSIDDQYGVWNLKTPSEGFTVAARLDPIVRARKAPEATRAIWEHVETKCGENSPEKGAIFTQGIDVPVQEQGLGRKYYGGGDMRLIPPCQAEASFRIRPQPSPCSAVVQRSSGQPLSQARKSLKFTVC